MTREVVIVCSSETHSPPPSPPTALRAAVTMGAVRPDRNALLRLYLLLSFCVSSSVAWDLVLLHTNDVHGRVEETSTHSGKCGGGGGCFAGVARRATMIQRIRSIEDNVLLLDAGDQFQGTVWFSQYKGAEAAHFMNKLRYDGMVRPHTRSSRVNENVTWKWKQSRTITVTVTNIRCVFECLRLLRCLRLQLAFLH